MAIAKRKKRFFDVEMPLIRKETQLQAFEVGELDGKFIKYDLTRILKGKGILLQLKVVVNEDKASSVPREINLMPFYLKRMVRKGTDYVEDSFKENARDAVIEIKPLLVTRRRVSKAVRRGLRQKAREELSKYVKSQSYEDLFEDILRNKLQKELSLKLKKIYPLALCEIRKIKVEKVLEDSGKKKSKKEEKKVEEVVESEDSKEEEKKEVKKKVVKKSEKEE